MTKKKISSKIRIYKIDATNKAVGRLASEVAIIIRGKKMVSYTPHVIPMVQVNISNINKIKINDKKFKNMHYKHSGYPGGLKKIRWQKYYEKGPEKLFMKVLSNMIPSNRQKKHLLKRIFIV